MPVAYRRVPMLMEEIEIAREDGSLPRLRAALAKCKVIVLDDWAWYGRQHDSVPICWRSSMSGSVAVH